MPDPIPALFRDARFAHPWRDYQARVLAALETHLRDDHLHVVAPPGSGKTVLGLEVLRRLGRPALVLVPTITIREQWLRRLRHDFLADQDRDAEVSRDLLDPRSLTVATYQALYSLFKQDQDGLLCAKLREHGLATLAVDEAHHLRSEWWRCLKDLKAALPGIRTLALTGTPPYDAPQLEWNRYASFCGEVDEEIGVPELVRDQNLCPHQDLAYLCIPDQPVLDELRGFRERVAGFVRDLALDNELAALLATLPGLTAPDRHLDRILKDTEFWLSVAVFMNGLMWEGVRALVKEMGLKRVRLPAFDIDWAQVLLQGLLFGEQARSEALTTRVEALRRRLRSIGVVERRRVRLRRDRHSRRLVRSAPGLLRGLSDVVEAESRAMGHRLQMVILTDNIRAADFPAPGQAPVETVKLGVVPIFEHLRRIRLPNIRLGILTGSLVVVPRQCLEALRETADGHGLSAAAMGVQELWHAPAFLRIQFNAADRQGGVAVITKLFSQGLINVLAGTAALLGEGWDAPAVNTLILASAVATYVSSNQMRGRAIRTQRENPFKAANIWHLAAVEPESTTTPLARLSHHPSTAAPQRHATNGGEIGGLAADLGRCANSGHDGDLGDLQQRFRAFVGLDLEAARISSGFARLGPLQCGFTLEEVQAWNAGMIRQAQHRDGLAQRWRDALGQASPGRKRLVRELTLNPRRFWPRFLWRPTGQAPTHYWQRLIVAWYAWRARRRVRKIARAVAEGLAANGVISAEAPLMPRVEASVSGRLQINLALANHLDQTRFVAALQQVFSPPPAPRYLLLRQARYYAVPAGCNENKTRAGRFAAAWRRRVGRSRLIYAHTRAGKLHLLKAREQALAEHFAYTVDIGSRWTSIDDHL